jgi:hypothetical protein
MKLKTVRKYAVLGLSALAVASLGGVSVVQAQTYLATFDSSISAMTGTGGGLAATATEVWDGAENGPNGPSGGSLYLTIPFANVTGWQELQLSFQPSANINLSTYIDVEFDIRLDSTNSHAGPNGYGAIYPVIQNWSGGSPGWGQLTPQFVTNNGTGWQHMKFQLVGVASSMDNFVLDFNTGGGAVTNTCAYWIDNIALTTAPLPPPTLTPPTAAVKQKGLVFLPATTGSYQRVMVYPNNATTYGWYGQATAGNPVSYSFTITNFPNVGHYGAQVFWIPVSSFQYSANDTSVDWNCTNDLVLSISGSGNAGAATNWGVNLSAKTNSPGSLGSGNPNLVITNYAYSTLPLGTWTVTFNNDTDFTITAPDNSVVSGSLPVDVASLISGNTAGNTAMAPYFGIQPNDPQGIGLATVFSNIKISGTPTTINDTFSAGTLDTNTWSILSDEPVDVFVSTGDLLYYVTWNTPNDQGYSTLVAASTAAGPWNDLVSSGNWMLLNGNKAAMITKSGLQSSLGQTQTALFRLLKRQFTQLQVLLPGETNAPGTVSGKVGTPVAQTTTTPTTVVVNACDSTWHIVNSGDQIRISCSDSGAFLPTDSSLNNGTVTFDSSNPLLFQTTGSQTVTATDLSNTNILSSTSSTVTVQ